MGEEGERGEVWKGRNIECRIVKRQRGGEREAYTGHQKISHRPSHDKANILDG